MKLDAGEIKDIVNESQSKLAPWSKAADVWQEDWELTRYQDTRDEMRELDGVDVVVSPDAYNVIQLLHRFVADQMRVEVPSLSAEEEDESRSEKIEEFLVAFERKNNIEQGGNLIHAKTWQSGVLARGASQVLCVEPALKKLGLSGKRLPISKRRLDPRNAHVVRSAMGIEFGYHKYKASSSYIRDMYPDYKLEEDKGRAQNGHWIVQGYFKEKYDIIDWWCRDKGSIWHAVVIDGKFAKQPVVSDYPEVPIIVWYADSAPVEDELSKSLSILHPIHELVKLKQDVLSKVATGVMYHYDPLVVAKGFGEDEKVEVGPGATAYLRENQSLDFIRPEPNVPMAEKLLGMIQSAIDQATFPSVSYGDGPGGASGYAINSLTQAARSRANVIRSNIEAAMEQENQLVLGLIEEFFPDKGIQIYGGSGREDRDKPILLRKKDIKGNYENKVMLIPEQPMDDNARILAWMQMVQGGIVSETLMRNRVLNIPIPRDEETRVRAEKALKSPQMELKANMKALMATNPHEEWELMFLGTEFQALYEQEKQWHADKARGKSEEAEAKRIAQEQAAQEAMAMQGMPPGMGGMPPGMMGQGSSQMPPGGMPFAGPPSAPPMGGEMPMPPDMGGMPPLPPGMTGPMGPPPPPMPQDMQPDMQPPGMGQPDGMPPQLMPAELAPQFTPESLGLGPETDPGVFQDLAGQEPLDNMEMMRRLGLLPPEEPMI